MNGAPPPKLYPYFNNLIHGFSKSTTLHSMLCCMTHLNVNIQVEFHLFSYKQHELKLPGPTAAIQHHLVRTYFLREQRGRKKGKTTTPPVVIRFLCNSTAVNSRQRSSGKSITDRNRIIKPPQLSSTWNVPPTQMKTIRLHSTSIMLAPTPLHL